LPNTERGYVDRDYIRTPDQQHLSQGDVISDVPLIVAPSRLIALDDVDFKGSSLSARRVDTFAGNAYALVQVEKTRAIILTYSCDIDRGLENIVSGAAPDPVELVTVTAVRDIDDQLQQKLGDIRAGRMPRFASIQGTTWQPELLIDYSAIQQISLRVLVPLAFTNRTSSLTAYGELKILERMAHAIGDQYRRIAPQGADDPNLFANAYARLTAAPASAPTPRPSSP
jgi:hypothetical protein